MNLDDVKVNETHLCVLRKEENGNKVNVDFVALKYRFQDQLDELNQMANNGNRTVLDLQDYVKGSPLRRLELDFDFCTVLSAPYQWIPCIQPITFADYQKELDKFDKEDDKEGKEAYICDKRHNYYDNIASRVLPAMIEDLTNEMYHDPSILAFSHRRPGWVSPAFSLNEDIRVAYITNFGYGSASYFFLQIFYKGIGILPYSHWVHYRIASANEIIRYTRRYHLANQEWMKAMKYTADVYNAAVAAPANFVQNNILSEVEEMISGLEAIRKSQIYHLQESFFNDSNIIIEGDNLIRFKGEKISGALDFLNQLQTLTPITDKADSYIQRIMDCNHSVISELQSAVTSKKRSLETILERIKMEQPKWDKLNTENEEFKTKRKEMHDIVAEEVEYCGKSLYVIEKECDIRFVKEYPEYEAFKKEYYSERELYINLCEKRDNVQSFIDEIQNYLDKIESYKNYSIEDNIAA